MVTSINASIVTITPAMAQELLKKTPEALRHRQLNKWRVAEYAELMEQNRWHFIGKSIVIDDHEHLRNGQHRLAACIQANNSITMVLVTGVPSENFVDD